MCQPSHLQIIIFNTELLTVIYERGENEKIALYKYSRMYKVLGLF